MVHGGIRHGSKSFAVVLTLTLGALAPSTPGQIPYIDAAEYRRNLFGIDLGVVTVSGGAPVVVYIDNYVLNSTFNRAWYDGLGYATLSDAPTATVLTIR